MAPSSRVLCQVCSTSESRYTCSKCPAVYCSVPCYKKHRGLLLAQSCGGGAEQKQTNAETPVQAPSELTRGSQDEETILEETPLRPLTSLNWPYVPEASAYPDPLKRDDPKTLQVHQYESIATSPAVRRVLAAHPRLKQVLRTVEALRGAAREEALQRGLGVNFDDTSRGHTHGRGTARSDVDALAFEDEEDRGALRELAEAIEGAVRGGNDAPGLDWGD
ncbi:hypothetical protein OF83DRAFT_871449 [Amylostereum chailletii]|nr:hypothetical protein OF83DRAFT_871449 [Amylostereum chailletii]